MAPWGSSVDSSKGKWAISRWLTYLLPFWYLIVQKFSFDHHDHLILISHISHLTSNLHMYTCTVKYVDFDFSVCFYLLLCFDLIYYNFYCFMTLHRMATSDLSPCHSCVSVCRTRRWNWQWAKTRCPDLLSTSRRKPRVTPTSSGSSIQMPAWLVW